ncbi:hypothetical protein Lser_V15G45815 [Lactuca serriola]
MFVSIVSGLEPFNGPHITFFIYPCFCPPLLQSPPDIPPPPQTVLLMADSKKYCPILYKNLSWSPEIQRRTEWKRLKAQQRRRFRRSKSLDASSDNSDITDDDIKELTACFELGFGFDTSNDMDPKLTQAFSALELYAAVNRQFNNRNLSRTSSTNSDSSSSSSNSNVSSSLIVDPSDDPEKVKMRLRRWAQVVACSIHHASRQPKTEVAEYTSE